MYRCLITHASITARKSKGSFIDATFAEPQVAVRFRNDSATINSPADATPEQKRVFEQDGLDRRGCFLWHWETCVLFIHDILFYVWMILCDMRLYLYTKGENPAQGTNRGVGRHPAWHSLPGTPVTRARRSSRTRRLQRA